MADTVLTSSWVYVKQYESIDDRLHKARTAEAVIKLLTDNPNMNVNSSLENGDTPLHTYVRRGDKGYTLLLALLSHSDPDHLDLEAPGEKLNTPLHVASQLNNLDAASALIAFGANVCAMNYYQQSPLDLAKNDDHQEMVDLLFSIGGELGTSISTKFQQYVILPHAPLDNDNEKINGSGEAQSDMNWKVMSTDFETSLGTLTGQAEESYSCWLKWRKKVKEMKAKNQHSAFPILDKKKGERVLFLDGGGMRGLIQTEVLSHITSLTGRSIPELFDWVVGTSTGGIVALALVYGPLERESFTIAHLRKTYFEIKDRVFGNLRLGVACDTEALEEILKRVFKDRRMTPVPQGTKVLISTVDKSTDKLEVCWFNNCFNDAYSGELIWKVARCTSAAPCYFKPMNNFVDGGLKVNNPSEDGMTKIQDYLKETSPHTDLMVVVSIGCGVFPPQEWSDSADVEKYLFFGKHWLKPWKLIEDAGKLVKLLAEGINNSESATRNTRSRCQGQRIAFYRFNPELDEPVQLSETDNKSLIQIILKARAHVSSKQLDFDMLIQSFYR